MKVLVTGAAGFIGNAVSRTLRERGDEVVGVDNLNDYYEVSLKQDRLNLLKNDTGFTLHKVDIADRDAMASLFETVKPDRVVHLAAQAGVRYSIDNPHVYADSNLVGFLNILEGCRQTQVGHLVYASTSSVYGANTTMPFAERHSVDHPVSLYAATKKANEVMAHSYAELYDLPCTGLRFFTVYGPWMRPDMALFKFAKKIVAGEPIDVYNRGEMVRDFTYIDDVVAGILASLDKVAQPDPDWDAANPYPAASSAPFRVYNIGNGNPVPLLTYIDVLERELGMPVERNYMPMQPGDVPGTSASVQALEQAVGYRPDTPVETGVARFVDWFIDYYGIKR